MKKAVYEKYFGKLSVENIEFGIKSCFENGCYLLTEAQEYSKKKKYNLAYYFSYTAEEEFIKITLLLYYYAIEKKEGVDEFWRYFRNHRAKKRISLLKRFITSTKKNNEILLENIYFLINENEYQAIRENALYCDAIKPLNFVLPSESFERRDSDKLIKHLNKEKKLWANIIDKEENLRTMIRYLEKNPGKYLSPNEAFKQTHGVTLREKITLK